ncbi:hypothetical protein D4764_03G0005410 [Takifugu flavidus]|uniref:Uncharacterized protein n=1 Tax=Takifugu flavidus TaxID=433684 RepID=A0A5C6N8P3_9TELE|nr:hypothetical protein D4764_03G0005410 [Takifugu flavidus]
MAAVHKILLLSLLLMLHLSQAHAASQDFVYSSASMLLSFLLLGLTVTLSGGVYLWVLRYVCIGCCQPIVATKDVEFLERIV